MRILVIDDFPDAAESLAELLAIHGHATQIALDAETALCVARTFQPEVILCDLMQPGAEGLALCARFRQEPNLGYTRFIAVTTVSGKQAGDRLHAAGFERHVVKPVDLGQLRAALSGT